MKTVHEVAALAGISKRTLQYYDEIGLLSPAQVTPAGYRLYSDAEMERLWRILFYKELRFPLAEIRALLDGPADQERSVLSKQRERLREQYEQMGKTLRSLDDMLLLEAGPDPAYPVEDGYNPQEIKQLGE